MNFKKQNDVGSTLNWLTLVPLWLCCCHGNSETKSSSFHAPVYRHCAHLSSSAQLILSLTHHVISITDLCMLHSDYTAGQVTQGPSPGVGGDYYLDPDAAVPVRPLRSQSFHTSGIY